MKSLRQPATLRRFTREGLPALRAQISGSAMLSKIEHLVSLEKWNSFDGFRKASQIMAECYARAGARTETYPVPTAGADGSGRWVIQCASDVHAGCVDVIAPVRRRLADFKDNPWCVVQWSAATPREGVRSDVVVIDTWEALRAIRAGSLRGNVILTSLAVWHAAPEFLRTGTDAVLVGTRVGTGFGSPPRACGKAHATEWTKLGWGGLPMEQAGLSLVAMALSEDVGNWLRQLVARHGTVRVQVRVDTRRYVGTHHLVSGIVPGWGDPQDEVWALAHTAEPGAADNASGVAACLAAAAAIEAAIRAGRLPRPRRSIRFLNGYECYGFFHYMEHVRRLQPALAGMVVDTLGQKTIYNNGRLTWHDTVAASAGFVNDVGEGIIGGALAIDNAGYHLVRQPFVSTEDTLVGDPKYGFPCPWLTTHYKADRVASDAYHTSDDTIDQLNPRGLRTCTTAVAGYLYYLANAGTRELVEMAQAHTANVLADLAAQRRQRSRAWADYRALRHHIALARLPRWMWGGDRRAILQQMERLESDVRAAAAAYGRAAHARPVAPASARRIPVRTRLLAPDMENIRLEIRQNLAESGLGRQPLFWADGVRSLADIAELHGHERGTPVTLPAIEKYFEAMAAAKFVDLIPPGMQVTRARLVADLRRLGLRAGMDVMVHSSLSRIGHVAGGAETVIDALLAVLGKRGTLLMPSFNHGLARVYNPATTPTINGVIPDAFWRRPEAERSLHGTHAVAAIGARAREYCAGHVEAGIWAADSAIGRLIQGGGYLLCLGAKLTTATAYHVAEVSVPCGCLDQKGGQDARVAADGSLVTQPGLVWRAAACPVAETKLEPALERRGKLARGKVGQAESIFLKAVELWRVRRQHLRNACPACKIRPDPDWKAKA